MNSISLEQEEAEALQSCVHSGDQGMLSRAWEIQGTLWAALVWAGGRDLGRDLDFIPEIGAI